MGETPSEMPQSQRKYPYHAGVIIIDVNRNAKNLTLMTRYSFWPLYDFISLPEKLHTFVNQSQNELDYPMRQYSNV